MDAGLYNAFLRRKSFHVFKDTGAGRISEDELEEIKAAWDGFEKLYPEIRTAIRIVPAKQFGFKQDAEYCILIYSEQKDNYLMNAGYMGEQLDLFLVDRNIGSLWYGMGRTDEKDLGGLSYVIMIAVRKVENEDLYRKDFSKVKRKPLGEIWEGDTLGIGELVRFAPSAVNSQPWFVRNEGGVLSVYRYRPQGLFSIMPLKAALYFNRIDIGIFLCILEICAAQKGLGFSRRLFADKGGEKDEYTKVAEYEMNMK